MKYLILFILLLLSGCKVNKETLTNIQEQKRVEIDVKTKTDSLFSIKNWSNSNLIYEEQYDSVGRITKKIYTTKNETGKEQVKQVKTDLNVSVKDSLATKIEHEEVIKKDSKPILSNLLPTYFWLIVVVILIFIYIKFKPF
ncbi:MULTISPECIES: hypothetical protein [Sphingobacterium]|uniref:hypothetical protein n=1 Tax=Sphingobacterium TaxID=28453 RepID=UPI0013DBA46B|nr:MULTISPECIES: hypothetical protein [unclassified Sphingobacterium]